MALTWFKNMWFGSKERAEIRSTLKKIETALEVLVENKVSTSNRPYKNLIFTGDKITIVENDGSVTTASCDAAAYKFVKEAVSMEEINRILFTSKPAPLADVKDEENFMEVLEEDKDIVENNKSIFHGNPDFITGNDKVYLKGAPYELPTVIKLSFIEILEKIQAETLNSGVAASEKLSELFEAYETLKMFTYKLFLNPVPQSRNELLVWIKNFNIKLTNTGNFLGYRRIVSVNNKTSQDRVYIGFISGGYIKVKGWKKSPVYFDVYQSGAEYKLIDIKKHRTVDESVGVRLGTLKDLYDALSDVGGNRYTDQYSKSYDIRIGATYKIREEDIDVEDTNKSCGGSLHLADGTQFTYSSYGDTPVVCIVDPRYVVKMDTGMSGKIGVRQMFVAAVTEQKDGKYVDIDEQALINFDEKYHAETTEELKEMLKNGDFAGLNLESNVFSVPLTNVAEIEKILASKVINI